MDTAKLQDHVLELIRRTSTVIPRDVQEVLELRKKLEEGGSRAEFAMDLILQNIGLAKTNSRPICQDTGYLSFYIHCPVGQNPVLIQEVIRESVREATHLGYLRQNSVDSLTGTNSGTNLGPGTPAFYFEFHEKPELDIRLIQKGGGCENMTRQYALPHQVGGKLFGRDLEGVRACILDAVNTAQGKGCAPGFLGISIGGDRATGLAWAKHQFLRPLDDVNPIPELAELEARVMDEANQLGVGPIGFGGKLSVGSCKIGARNRLPASFYVSIAYMCWAYRRRGILLDQNFNVKEWLYQPADEFDRDFPDVTMNIPSDNVIKLNTPVTEEEVRSLKVGDVVLLSGQLFTGRDAVHKYLHEGGELDLIKGGLIYHCGPVIKKEGNNYQALAAGPTTSIREEPYQSDIIDRFGIKAIIGKGGMGPKTSAACKQFGAVYLHAIGGAAQIYAQCIKRVVSVHLEEFGSPEAVWEFEVEDFPAVVTMDAHGNSLHADLQDESDRKLKGLLS